MHGLKSIGWVCVAVGWVSSGWRVVPNVFATSFFDGFMVAVAFFFVVVFCFEQVIQHLEKAVQA